MQEAIQKADTLIEALGWIRRFRDKIVVIKFGGSVMEDDNALRHVLIDIVFMETVGMRPVVVHGGGAAISRAMDKAGLKANFIQGRRYTDDATLKIVEDVLAYETNESIARRIEEYGGRAMNLNFRSTNVLYGERITLPGKDGEAIDLGHVGRVTRVDRGVIENLCYAGQVPIIPSMALDETTGGKLNVNADTAATAVAQALGAEKLMYMSDVNGVRRDKNDPNSILHSLTASEARGLIASGAVEGGMIPKIEACLETLDNGVQKVHIIDGRVRHSLLLEIYTTRGVGTEIVADQARSEVSMSIATRLLTAEEYAALPDTGTPTELIRGIVVTMNPPRLLHGLVCSNVSFLFRTYARQHQCGRVFSNDSGVITERDPDTVRGADVAYYAYARLPKGELPGYSPAPPEVVVEVLSPDDRPGRVAAKVQEYLNVGVSAVVVLDPEIETAHIYHSGQAAVELAADQELRLTVITPEFSSPISAFFEDP